MAVHAASNLRRRGWCLSVRSALAAVALLGLAPLPGAAISAAATAAKPARYTFVLVPGETTDPFYITMHSGASAEAQKLGVTLKWAGSPEFEAYEQIPIVYSELATRPSALLIAPTDDVALFTPLDAWVHEGIPVITVDTTLKDTSILTAAISSANFQGGEAAARALAKLAHGKGDVAVIGTEWGTTTTDLRQTGFLAEMKNYPKMRVVATLYAHDSQTLAEADARALLLTHPGLVGLFATNLFTTAGAGEGVVDAGRKGKVIVVGYDAEPAEVQLLKHGVVDVLVVQQPAQEGALAVRYAYDYLTGHKSLMERSVLLPNVVITTATAEEPGLSRYFYRTSFRPGQ